MFRPLLIALQFLTILPIRINAPPDAEATGRSLLYYPLVGLLIGALLAAALWMLGDAPPLLTAAVLLALWVSVTGALHLDGLADSLDAWVGGHGDRERTLAIMKDPYCGPVGVVALVLVLLIKFASLAYLAPNGHWESLVVVPVVGRTALVLLFLTTPYVRPHGLGSLIANHMPRHACVVTVILTLVAIVTFTGMATIGLFATVAGVFLMLRRLMLRRLGGTTGDTAGTLVEITEAAALLTTALMY
jgi:adenosylcobinamide-GDP ribazoletransferase